MTAFCDKFKLTKYLVIVESPAKCKKIEEYLGQSYKCMASYGHLRTIASLKDIDITNNFEPTYSLLDDKIKFAQYNKIKEEIVKVDEIIIATDDDREGEAIAWHICQLFSLPLQTTKRIIFHEITESSILKAICSPTIINMNMVYSQQARQVLDLLVGFIISPMLWKLIQYNKNNALSAGRCQTPALRLIYDNYKEIQTNPGTKVYNTTGYFTKLVLPFSLNKEYNNKEDMEYFLESSVNHDHVFTRTNPKKTVRNPGEPFTTSRIQQVVSNELHYSPKETMKICQTLYEEGLITYMRTDSKKYCLEFVESCKQYITKTYSEQYISLSIDQYTINDASKNKDEGKTNNEDNEDNEHKSKTKVKTNKEKGKENHIQEAHEAIRPTNISRESTLIALSKLGSKENKVYELIWRNSLESLMAVATFSSFLSKISAFEDNEYKYSSEQVIFPGWLVIANKYEKESKEYAYLLALKQNSILEYKKIESNQTLKHTKSHYTEAHLVSLLEDNGIGRPSTYASLIDKIQERNYVKKFDVVGKEVECVDFTLENDTITESIHTRIIGNEKNKLVIQQLGIIVVEFLQKNFEKLFNYDYTKKMENDLDQVANGKAEWHDVCRDCYTELSALTDLLKNEKKMEIIIDSKHTYIIGKNGPVIKCVENNKTTFKPVKKDIDINKLEEGLYELNDIIDNTTAINSNYLGKYKDEDLIVKKGRFGLYAIYGENTLSLSSFGNRPVENITYKEVFEILEEDGLLKPSYYKDQKKLHILREISPSLTLRKGKWGQYIYYQNTQMKTPKFLDLKTFEKDTGTKAATCELNIIKKWIKDKYNAG
jgi:DNA topoisomerase-1